MGCPNLHVLLPKVIVGIGIVRPDEQCLQTIMPGKRRRFPRDRGECGFERSSFNVEIGFASCDRIAGDTNAEAQIGERHRQIQRRSVVGAIPDSYADVIISRGQECKWRHRQAPAENLNVRVVPSDGQTHLHEVVLRVDEWVGPLEDGWGNGDASAAAVATLAAIVAGIGYRATEAFQCWHQNHQAGKQVAYGPWDRLPPLRDAAHKRLLHHLGLIVRSKTNVFSTTSRSVNFTSTCFGEGNARSRSAGTNCARSFIVATSACWLCVYRLGRRGNSGLA